MAYDSFTAHHEEQLSSSTAEGSTPLLCTEPVEAASPAVPETSAIISKSGDLRFFSENDTEFLDPRDTKKKQTMQMNETEFQANNDFTSNRVEEHSKKDITKKKKKKKKRTVKATKASGTSNDAFDPDILQA
ncbi:UNVERIFIED_CONTAM: hypothetical protein K2H54_073917 [Gekko kuhli]